jgi:hypothetical protein
LASSLSTKFQSSSSDMAAASGALRLAD